MATLSFSQQRNYAEIEVSLESRAREASLIAKTIKERFERKKSSASEKTLFSSHSLAKETDDPDGPWKKASCASTVS